MMKFLIILLFGSSALASTIGQMNSSSESLNNMGLTATVSANAMTVTAKTGTGGTPIGYNAIQIGSRSSTATSGTYSVVLTTSTASVVVPSSATLGQTSAIQQYTYVYMQANNGVNQVCVSSNGTLDEGSVYPSTAISASATSSSVLYCTTGATGPVRLVGRISATEATAGTWATAPSEISLRPFTKFPYQSEVWVYTQNGYGSTNTKIPRFTTTQKNVGTAITYADSATLGASFTINENGIYAISFTCDFTASANAGISLNSNQLTTNIENITAADRVGAFVTTSGTNAPSLTQVTLGLRSGDVIRPHTDGNTLGANPVVMRITKVSQ